MITVLVLILGVLWFTLIALTLILDKLDDIYHLKLDEKTRALNAPPVTPRHDKNK